MVARLLAKSSIQFYRLHPLQLLLSIVGIVLGVGIVSAVLITNNSSKKAFALSTEALYGRVNYQIFGPSYIEQKNYVQLKTQFSAIKMAPIIEGYVTIDNRIHTLLGIDPFAELSLDRAGLAFPKTIDTPLLLSLLTSEGVLVSSPQSSNLPSATNNTIKGNQFLNIEIANERYKSPVLGTYQSANAIASQGLLIADIAYAQVVLGKTQTIDRIDLWITEFEKKAIEQALPPELKLQPSARQQETMQAMTRGFQINLTAMSLLSLLVGAFLIHNTMTFAVLQRRELFAVTRIIGVSANAILATVLCEALIISLVGSCLGVVLGYFLSIQLIQLTTQTINDLYFVLRVQQVWLSPFTIALSLLLGIGTSLLAASLSALQAAKTSPLQARRRSGVELKVKQWLPILLLSGVLAGLLGVVLALIPSQSLLLGFLALMLIIFGYGLCLPWVCFALSRLLKNLTQTMGPVLTLAITSIEHNISRTGLAVAALSIAVASTFGVELMIGSFRNSVDQWLGSTLHSDLYVSSPSNVNARSDGTLNPQVLNKARKLEHLQSISLGRTVKVSTQFGKLDMLALQPHNNNSEQPPEGITLLSDNSAQSWHQFFNANSVFISEPLANKHGLKVGDHISLFTNAKGDTPFSVAGIYRDYGTSFGKLTIYREQYLTYFNDNKLSAIGLKFKSDNEQQKSERVQSALSTLRTQLQSNKQALLINANSDIHTDSLAVFDRTFAVTKVLRWLTVGVAFIGIFSALLAMNLERRREFAVLRATGATRPVVFGIIGVQTLIMGLMAGVLALPLGWIMSQVLIHVINLRSFGWSMQSFIPSNAISSTLALSLGAALLAGLYPAWSMSRASIASQLRDE